MTFKTCLRCDWQGEGKEPGCPNCGERPLYVVGPSRSEGTLAPGKGDPEERSRNVPSTAGKAPLETESPPVEPIPIPGGQGRTIQPIPGSAVALVVAALVTVILGTWFNADQERSAPAASSDAAVVETPSSETSPSPTPEGVRRFEAPPTRRHENIVNSVNGVPFSFSVPTSGWERFGSISTNKSESGPQGAEAIIYWSTFPDGDYVDPYGNYADPCANLLGPRVGPSVADLAAAVSTAPGTELVTGPSNVTVGGYPAKQVVLVVRKNVGCDPGYFYAWDDVFGGAIWATTPVDATMSVWIADVDGTRVFIVASTTEQATSDLDQEIQEIVGSIRFD